MTSLRERMAKGMSITLSEEDEAAAATMKPSGMTTGPGQTMQIQALRKQLEEARAELTKRNGEAASAVAAAARIRALEEQLATASCLEIPLNKLHEVPGRRRYMLPEKYIELRENLRHNRLITPISVQVRPDGDFDIVSGHHRSDAYRDLERETIRGVIEQGTTDEADDGAFWANLMQSDLTDYEKYAGIKRFHAKHLELNQSSLAERVGISQSHISALLSFDRLPTEARAYLDENKALIGASAAAELAALTDAGKGARVSEAMKRMSERQLDQSQAVRFVKEGDRPKATPQATTTFKIRSGKSTWCDVRRAKNVMRIEFHSEETAKAVQDAIKMQLEVLAAAQTGQKKD